MNRNKVSLSSGLLFALGLVPLMAPGANAADEQLVVQDTMVVTAGRVLEKKENVTTNISVFTEEDLEELAVDDVGDLLRKEGFFVREYPNSLTSIGMRGFLSDSMGNDLSSYILILVDGRPAGNVNLEQFSTDSIERVEVIRGPASVQYGTRAMGGVINIITKKAKKGFRGSAEATVGSWDYNKQQVELSGAGEKFDARLTASRSSQGDYDTGSGATYRNTGYDAKNNINLNVGFTPVQHHRIGMVYSFNEIDKAGSPNYLSSNDLDDYVERSQDNVDFTYDGQDSKGFLQWKARYYTIDDKYDTYDPTYYGSRADYTQDTDKQGAQFQTTAKWDFVQLTGGVDWNDYEIANSYSYNGRASTYENEAAFLFAKTFLLDDRLVLSAGVRYDDFTVEGDMGDSTDADNTSMSVGAVYKIIEGLSIRANYAEAFKMPTPDQLFMYTDYSAIGWGLWMGNEDLEPESSETYEVGIDYTRGAFSAGLTWFHTDFSDKITYEVVNTSPLTYMYENVGDATYEGFEGNLQVNIAEYFGWDIELIPYVTFTAMSKYENDNTGEDLYYVPDFNASYGIRFNNEAWGFTSRLNCAYYGEHYITDYEGTGEKTLGHDTVVDISATKKIHSFHEYGDLSVKGQITNLFDTDYALVQGYPSPGRTFFVGLNYTF